MKKIYNELRSHEGKLTEFANVLVEKGVYNSLSSALQALRHNVKPMPIVNDLYTEWRPGRLKTKDMKTYVDKTKEVFKEIKQRTLKQELLSIVDVLEEALKELTLAIKSDNKQKLYEVKDLLQQALYGAQE